MPPTASTRILLIDHDFPEPDRDAGSRAVASFADLLVDAGVEVVFWAASTAPSAAGRALLQQQGIIALSQRDTGPLNAWLERNGQAFKASVLSRPLVAAMYQSVVGRHIKGICVYYGHDIHHRRLQAMQTISTGTLADRWESLLMKVIEQRLWRLADVTLYPSVDEAEVVNAHRAACGRVANAEMFPLWTLSDASPMATRVSGRRGLLFVGSRAHAPNVDGLNWFLREVVPHLQLSLAQCTLTIVGSGMEAYTPPATNTLPLDIRGRVDDVTLRQCYATARLVIAPLRFGGGVKGKVLEAIGEGVPCVLTPAAAQGLAGIEALLPVNGGAVGYARALEHLMGDDVAWSNAAGGAYHYLSERYDRTLFVGRLRALLLD